MAIGSHRLGGIDYSGTFYIDDDSDDDMVGAVFSFIDNTKFYLATWKKSDQGPALVSI